MDAPDLAQFFAQSIKDHEKKRDALQSELDEKRRELEKLEAIIQKLKDYQRLEQNGSAVSPRKSSPLFVSSD